jgi:hypothetical protein
LDIFNEIYTKYNRNYYRQGGKENGKRLVTLYGKGYQHAESRDEI